MFTNHTNITVFCSSKFAHETVWTAHPIKDVNWHKSDQLLVGDKEVKNSDECIIRIPNAALTGYVDKATYKSLQPDELQNYFTLKKDDYVVKGLIDCEVSSSAEILKMNDCYKIVEVTENLSASLYSKHIKLVVK